MERDFKGVWIPKDIWLNEELSMIEKVLLIEIDSLDNEEHCTASNEYFAGFCNCSDRTVSRAINHLKELGYIEELPYNGRYRKLRVVSLSIQTRQNVQSDTTKCPPSNIDNNIDSNISNFTNVKLEQTKVAHTNSQKPLIDTSTADSLTDKKKKSRYEQCIDVTDEFFKDEELKSLLADYLTMRLGIKDKPMYVSGWKALMRKLQGMSDDVQTLIRIVSQSLENSWATFYMPKTNNYNRYNTGLDVFNEFGKVRAERSSEEDRTNVQF